MMNIWLAVILIFVALLIGCGIGYATRAKDEAEYPENSKPENFGGGGGKVFMVGYMNQAMNNHNGPH